MIAVFLDRDGTIGGTGWGIHPFEFTVYEYTPEAIRILNEMGIKVFLFTNQSRIGRGYFTEEELLQGFEQLNGLLKKEGAFIDGMYYCPHKPDDGCECHKPKAGLLMNAKSEHHLDLTKCYVVGDNGSADMVAASLVGARKVIVRTGWGENSLSKYRSLWKEIEPDYLADNILDAAKWISKDLNGV